ncbi:MAG: AmmeMemoRadiSam system protein A [Acidimicrobiales bacterium]
MAPSPSPEAAGGGLPTPERELLLDLAEAAIRSALGADGAAGALVSPILADLPPALRRVQDAFVTLTVDGELHGCIGALGGDEPLGREIPHVAVQAACRDRRFPALRAEELGRLGIEVSLLSPLEPLAVSSQAELLAALRPGEDGLVVRAEGRRGLFLPTVWSTLPDPRQFVDRLWLKAGLTPGTWGPDTEVLRFSVEHFSRRLGAPGGSWRLRPGGRPRR